MVYVSVLVSVEVAALIHLLHHHQLIWENIETGFVVQCTFFILELPWFDLPKHSAVRKRAQSFPKFCVLLLLKVSDRQF